MVNGDIKYHVCNSLSEFLLFIIEDKTALVKTYTVHVLQTAGV